MDTTRRSLAKSLSWRLLATLITAAIVWLLTGEVEFAAKVGLADTSSKFLVYFFHERAWNRVAFGRRTEPEYQI